MSVSGSYRTVYREQCGMILLRKKGHSINQIAGVMGRSTRTVWNIVKGMPLDNRTRSYMTRNQLSFAFKGRFNELKVRVRLFLRGLSWDEAMKLPLSRLVIHFLSETVSKNDSEEEEEDPA